MRILLLLALLSWPAVSAAEDPLCPDDPPARDKHTYLRALSLDLRGVVPTIEEHQALDELDDVPEAWIDAWLSSDEFVERTLRFHRDLLWLKILDADVVNTRSRLTKTGSNNGDVHWRRDAATMLRGDVVPCLDEPATWNAQGLPNQTWVPDLDEDDNELETGTWREGYVNVVPYWDPTDSIKVCAFDSIERAESDDGDLCATFDGQGDEECGCGPGLAWCSMPGANTIIRDALVRDVELRIEQVVRGDQPYTELFTGTTGYVNGPLAYWWRFLAPHANRLSLTPRPMAVEGVPMLGWHDTETWLPYELGPQHAGILTSLPFLLRFASDRARANRFYERFLCRPFVPPAGGIPTGGDELMTLDLQERDGCKYCHALLEPSAAHWGRWTEVGAGYLDPAEFPPEREDCVLCATTSASCSQECRDHYVVEALGPEEEPFLGQLRAYEFREEAHQAGVEEGPSLLARQAIVDGRLPRCTAENAANWLLGDRSAEPEWYDQLGVQFVDDGFSWRELVRRVVTSDSYRRVQ